MFQPVYGIHRIMGAETEYGVISPDAPDTNPTILSAIVVNTYEKLEAKRTESLRRTIENNAQEAQRTRWSTESESPLTDVFGHTVKEQEAHSSQLTHTRRELTSEDIALEALREAGIDGSQELIHGRGGYPERLDWDRVTMNAMLANGARLYVDHAHPEYSSPEVLTPLQAVLYDATGDKIAYDSITEVAQHSNDNLPAIKLYKNNTDSKGQSYGAHENYLISRDIPFEDVASTLLTFFATRIIYTGAGRVGIGVNGEIPGFQISSRADFFERPVGLETTIRRPIVNTRDEPHANSERYRRLHVIPADANLSHYSNLLKFGTATLVLNLIESGRAPNLHLADSVTALHTTSHDLSLSAQLPLTEDSDSTTKFATALEIQRAYLNACKSHEHENPTGVDNDTQQILALWEETLDALETNPLALADRLDWVAKYALVSSYVAKGVPYTDAKLKALDIHYADIDPTRGLYHRLVARGRMRTLFTPQDIEDAAHTPPSDTRAYLRGTLMSRWPDEIIGINWDTVSCRGRYSHELTRLVMPEPTRYTQSEVDPLLPRVTHSDELLQLLQQNTTPHKDL